MTLTCNGKIGSPCTTTSRVECRDGHLIRYIRLEILKSDGICKREKTWLWCPHEGIRRCVGDGVPIRDTRVTVKMGPSDRWRGTIETDGWHRERNCDAIKYVIILFLYQEGSTSCGHTNSSKRIIIHPTSWLHFMWQFKESYLNNYYVSSLPLCKSWLHFMWPQ